MRRCLLWNQAGVVILSGMLSLAPTTLAQDAQPIRAEAPDCPPSLADRIWDSRGDYRVPGLEALAIPVMSCFDKLLVVFELRSLSIQPVSAPDRPTEEASPEKGASAHDPRCFDLRLDGVVRSVLQWDGGADRPEEDGSFAIFARSVGGCREGVLVEGHVYVLSVWRVPGAPGLVLLHCENVLLPFGKQGDGTQRIWDFETRKWVPVTLGAFESAFREFVELRDECPGLCEFERR